VLCEWPLARQPLRVAESEQAPESRQFMCLQVRAVPTFPARLLPVKQRRCIFQHGLHVGWKHVSCVGITQNRVLKGFLPILES
jgi:hypothetical protein